MGDGKTKSRGRGRLGRAFRWAPSTLLRPVALAALGAVALFAAFSPSPAGAAFGFESLSSTFSPVGGADAQLSAGAHPESWTTTLAFNSAGPPGERHPEGSLKDLRVELPAGLIAAPGLLPHCSHADFLQEACPPSTAVGSIDFVVAEPLSPSTVFLLEAIPGQAAELGFYAFQIPVTIEISISPVPPHNLIASFTNASQATELFGSTLRLEGIPNGHAFLTLPRACAEPLQANFSASSWQDPTDFARGTAPEPQSVAGCGSLAYSPSLEVAPTTAQTASTSGVDLNFDAPDAGLLSVDDRAAADTESATVTLPPGLTINPPVAAGLTACDAAQLSAETSESEPGEVCPEGSKLGNATVTTPLFSEAIVGSVYLGMPEGSADAVSTSQANARFGLYLVLRDAERGLFLSFPLQVDADVETGRLTVSMEQIPQLPITHLELHLNSGPRAPLTTSATCGSEAITYSLTPSSGNPAVEGVDKFTTSASDCTARFAPSLSAGTISAAAGHSAPFVFELGQGAADPDLAGLSITLPPGLSAAFTGIASCPDSQATSGDCPGGSKLGYARIALGSGPEPLWVPPGEEPDSAVYLAGPYKGAPYSLVIVVPARAGPFDLGTVVLRAPITIDPLTAQAGLSIEGLPQILAGVPLHYRTIRVVLDRPGFIRNPTSCEPSRITGTALAADGSTANISTRFQATDCAALEFKPRLSLRLSGALGRNGHPAARAVLRGDADGAAVSSADFTLPAGELLDLSHLRGLCPRGVVVTRCSKKALLGHLRLQTSLLDAPLEGSVYLRVPSHRLPELSAEVSSGGLAFAVDGRITRAKGRLGFSLGSIPDVPLTEAVLELPGGRKGLIVNSGSLCASPRRVKASFSAHNGMKRRLSVPAQVAGCR